VIAAKDTLHNGDGICFFDEQDDLLGTNINNVNGNKIVPEEMTGINKGTVIYRNHDRIFIKNFRQTGLSVLSREN